MANDIDPFEFNCRVTAVTPQLKYVHHAFPSQTYLCVHIYKYFPMSSLRFCYSHFAFVLFGNFLFYFPIESIHLCAVSLCSYSFMVLTHMGLKTILQIQYTKATTPT